MATDAREPADPPQRVVRDRRLLDGVPALHEGCLEAASEVVHAHVVGAQRERHAPLVRVGLDLRPEQRLVLVEQGRDVLDVGAAHDQLQVERAGVRKERAVVVGGRRGGGGAVGIAGAPLCLFATHLVRVVDEIVRVGCEVEALVHKVAEEVDAREGRLDDRRPSVGAVAARPARAALACPRDPRGPSARPARARPACLGRPFVPGRRVGL